MQKEEKGKIKRWDKQNKRQDVTFKPNLNNHNKCKWPKQPN